MSQNIVEAKDTKLAAVMQELRQLEHRLQVDRLHLLRPLVLPTVFAAVAAIVTSITSCGIILSIYKKFYC